MVHPIEKVAVAEVVTRLFHALDARDWETIAALTTEPIDLDYPSKQGGPELVSTDEFIAGLQSFLPGFDATQHLLGPIVVELDKERTATARFDARVTHVLTETTDAPIWVIGCHYTLGLKQEAGEWRASSSRVRVTYEEGNPTLQAAARNRAHLSPL